MVGGPLSSSRGGIALFMKDIIDTKLWRSEPALIPMPWKSSFQVFPKHPSKIGILAHDGLVTPHPPITNTLNTVVAKMRKIPCVSIIPWKPNPHDEAWAIISSLYFADMGKADASKGQMGARKHRSAINAAALLIQKVQEVWQNRKIAGALFMDVKGAFDHVSRAQLAQRMSDLGIDDDVIGWTQSFLTDR